MPWFQCHILKVPHTAPAMMEATQICPNRNLKSTHFESYPYSSASAPVTFSTFTIGLPSKCCFHLVMRHRRQFCCLSQTNSPRPHKTKENVKRLVMVVSGRSVFVTFLQLFIDFVSPSSFQWM